MLATIAACSPSTLPLLPPVADASAADSATHDAQDATTTDASDASGPSLDALTDAAMAPDVGSPAADVVDAGAPAVDVIDAGSPAADIPDVGVPSVDVVDAGAVCAPGAASCTDRLTRRTCNVDGLGFTSATCPSDGRCQGDGVCQTYRDLVLSSRPVAYWRFEEGAGPTATDEIAGRVATAVSGVGFAQPGLISSGRALRISGQQYLNVPYAAVINPAEFSVEVWARVAGSQGTYRSPFTSRFNVPTQGYALYVNPSNRWELYVGDGTALEWQPTSGGDAVVLGRTYHVVAAFGAGSIRLYVNGAMVASRTGVTLRTNARGGGRIGAGATEYPAGADYFFDGVLDELAVYDRPLGADEVTAHWTHGSGP